MSAEQLVSDLIDNALVIAQEKSDLADTYASQAMSAASGTVGLNFSPFDFAPGNIEPPVTIPQNATGVDSALYDSTYDRIQADLSDKFAGFFTEYFPNECDYFAKAQDWLCDVLANGGTGMNASVEDQIWQRDRSRVLKEVNRASREVLATFASRGFPMPPGAAAHQITMLQQRALEESAKASRDVAIKQAEIEIENVRFAVKEAIDLRIKAISAAAEFMKAMALGPEIAARLATSAADAQAKLINAASQYYDARIRVEQLKYDVVKSNATLLTDVGKTNVTLWTDILRAKASTAVAVAGAAGTMAASALNSLNSSASVAVQGETS